MSEAIICYKCKSPIPLDGGRDAWIGRIASCPECDTRIKVSKTTPLADPADASQGRESSFEVECPNCETLLELDGTIDDYAGMVIECPSCHFDIEFEDDSEAG